jgi:ABC-type glycerol-3-phosphate transport system substrate-binding protein
VDTKRSRPTRPTARARAAVIALVAVVALSALSATAYSRSDRQMAANAGKPGDYTLLSFQATGASAEWLKLEVALFQKANPGVKVTIKTTNPTNIVQDLKTAIAGGKAPDMVQMLPGAASQQLWRAKKLLNLTPFINRDAEWKAWTAGWKLVPNSQYRDGDSIFMANETMGPMVIWYWKDQLATAGYKTFPKDIPGLIALSKALRAKKLQPIAFGMNSKSLFDFDYTFYTLLSNWDPGGKKGRLAGSGKYPWTSSEFKKAADLFKRLYDEGVFYDGALEKSYDPDSKADFGSKKAAMAWPFGPWMAGAYPDSTVKNIGVALWPQLTKSTPITLTSSNDIAYSLPVATSAQRDPQRQATMVALLKQLSSPRSQASIWAVGSYPVMPEVASKPSKSAWAPVLKAQITAVKAAKYATDENTYGPNTYEALTNGLQALVLGQTTSEKLLADVQKANRKDFPCAPTCK